LCVTASVRNYLRVPMTLPSVSKEECFVESRCWTINQKIFVVGLFDEDNRRRGVVLLCSSRCSQGYGIDLKLSVG
jgi:hypothetical protein